MPVISQLKSHVDCYLEESGFLGNISTWILSAKLLDSMGRYMYSYSLLPVALLHNSSSFSLAS
jgi:hypothetical protein